MIETVSNFVPMATLLASVASVFALVVITIELYKNLQMRKTEFEDHIYTQFLDLSFAIPVDAMLGEEVDEERTSSMREALFNYMHLSDHVAFLRNKGRIRAESWVDFCGLIERDLGNPDFTSVWGEIVAKRPGHFKFLSKLIDTNFKQDPYKWSITN